MHVGLRRAPKNLSGMLEFRHLLARSHLCFAGKLKETHSLERVLLTRMGGRRVLSEGQGGL